MNLDEVKLANDLGRTINDCSEVMKRGTDRAAYITTGDSATNVIFAIHTEEHKELMALIEKYRSKSLEELSLIGTEVTVFDKDKSCAHCLFNGEHERE